MVIENDPLEEEGEIEREISSSQIHPQISGLSIRDTESPLEESEREGKRKEIERMCGGVQPRCRLQEYHLMIWRWRTENRCKMSREEQSSSFKILPSRMLLGSSNVCIILSHN